MKKAIITFMIAEVIVIFMSIYLLLVGKILIGSICLILNIILFILNLNRLKNNQ